MPDDQLGPDKTPGLETPKFQGPDLGELVKTATSSYDEKPINDLIDRVRDIPKREAAELDPMRKKFADTVSADQTRAEDKYKAISPVDVQPWSQKPPENDPWKSFGAPGTVFAMIASAFTRTPMTNALNAGAASMNAVRAGDLNAYRSAFDAWKENTKMALERHDAQYKDYQAASDLYKTDVSAGDAAMRALSAKYGDEMTGVLREAGLQGELGKLWQGRQSAAEKMIQVYPALEKFGIQQEGYLGDERRLDPDPNVRNEVYREWFDPSYWHSVAGGRSGTTNPITLARAEAIKKQMDEFRTKNNREPNGVEQANIISEVMKGGLTGNEGAKLKSLVDQYDNSLDKLDGVLGTLDEKFGVAGAPGYATRLGEVVGNVFGSDETSRAQFKRDLEYLQMQATRLMTASQGRPLAAEANRINDIVAGLSLFGTTGANTKRALEEVQKLYMKMRGDTLSIIQGAWKPAEEKGVGAPAVPGVSPAAPAAPTTKKKGPWDNDVAAP